MFLKLMSDEDLPDEDPCKGYTIVEGVEEVSFFRSSDGRAFVDYLEPHGSRENRPLHGNVYVLNDAGEKVDGFGIASPYAMKSEKDYQPQPNWPDGPSGGPIPAEIDLPLGLDGEGLGSEDQRDRDRKIICGYLHSIRAAGYDLPLLREIVHKAPEAHYEALVSAAVQCAVQCMPPRDVESGQEGKASIIPDVIKATGTPNSTGGARVYALREALTNHLKRGDNLSRETLAATALRLYAWEYKVYATDDAGFRAMENLRRVADATFVAIA